jgi:hypothetical protein
LLQDGLFVCFCRRRSKPLESLSFGAARSAPEVRGSAAETLRREVWYCESLSLRNKRTLLQAL